MIEDEEKSKDQNLFNTLTQFLIPILTIGVQVAIAFKHPEWGLVINMIAQPFWIYSAWRAYREAGQIGLLITTIIVTIVIGFGLANYWLF